MHFTLHLTNDCNMACHYCYVDNSNIVDMTFETAKKAIDLAAAESEGSIGVIFFGGEPLLHKELIFQTIEYCRWKEDKFGSMFHYKVTTNGLLLDQDFIYFSLRENLFIAMSHDGIEPAHNKHRLDRSGHGTFAKLEDKVSLLLSARPYSPVMMVVNPDTAEYYYDSVRYLYRRGFRYIICSLNYAADWDESSMAILRRQYEKLADFYYEMTLAEEKFYLSPFEVKISSHINQNTYCHERCELGKKQLSIAPDGAIYPCVQFAGDNKWSIGHVDSGIDYSGRQRLFTANEQEKESCRDCSVRMRCNHHCGCLNKQATGSISEVSPALCAHERIILPIADKLATRLFKKRSPLFIQKHYNEMFPLLSFIEDSSAKKKI